MSRGSASGPAGGKKAPPLSLKARALALLAQRDHSAAELRRKLLRHARAAQAAIEGPTRADDALDGVDAAMAWLLEQGHLSEERFVESRVHARSARYGNLRIRHELAQHGLELPPEAAQALQASELDRATAVWRRKFGHAPSGASERARQSRFLAQRGFSPGVIARLMRGAAGQDAGDEVLDEG